MGRPAISLVGPMGAGKTEVGKVVAGKLQREFIDTDELVVKTDGRGIGQIFAEDGEAGFRKIESRILAEAAARPGVVIACGGGAVLDPANVSVLKEAGKVVYLKASPQVSASRVGSGEGRPLLASGETLAALAGLFSERGSLYEEAADAVVIAEGTVDEIASRVVDAVGEDG
ncbi:MAG: shikimate kinase [Actinomycetota bacterium]